MSTKTLLVMAGGTGGHVFPAMAVADLLRAEGWRIHWLGTPKRMEAELVPAHGFDISFIDVEGVRGNGLKRLIVAPFKLLRGIWQARKLIKHLQPDVVMGMGGFAAGPGGIAARLCGVPLLIHEQNAAAGMTNRMLAPLASYVMSGFNHTDVGSARVHWVGNPLRAQIQPKALQQVPHSPLRILVVGGSLGAQILNDTMPLLAAQLGDKASWRHQCGKGRADSVRAVYPASVAADVTDFIDDMAAAYQWADLVICRAGALTVSEIAATGVAAIFVPLPHAVDDHQAMNAQTLVSVGAARMLRQSPNFLTELSHVVHELLAQPIQLNGMAQAALRVARPDATAVVANACKELAGVTH